MDDTLRLIRYLYGEEADESEVERRLEKDKELRREYERLRNVKKHLDRRRPCRPDRDVVDRIVQEARTATESSDAEALDASDRAPRGPDRSWSRRLQAVSAGLALVLVLGLAWWRLPLDPGSSAQSTQPTAQREVVRTRGAVGEQTPDDVPAWDDSDELVRIQQNIERLQARSGPNSWGTLQTVDHTRP